MLQATYRVSGAPNSFFAGEAAGDVLLCPGTSNQRILIGNAAGSAPMLTVDSNYARIAGDLLPDVTLMRNLGAPDLRFKDLFLSGSTIDLGGTLLQSDGTAGAIKISDSTTGQLMRLVVDEIQVGRGDEGSDVMVLQRGADNTLRVFQAHTDSNGNAVNVGMDEDLPLLPVDPVTSNVAYHASNAAFFSSNMLRGGDAAHNNVVVSGVMSAPAVNTELRVMTGFTIVESAAQTTVLDGMGMGMGMGMDMGSGSNTVSAPTTFLDDVTLPSPEATLAVGGNAFDAANSVLQVQGVPDAKAAVATSVAATSAQTHLRFLNPSGVVGSVETSGSTTSYNTASDYRLKEAVQPLPGADAVESVMRLRPVSFAFKADPSERVQGFLAHEVQQVVPMAVSGAKDGMEAGGRPVYQAMDAAKLIPVLTAAIQHQQQHLALMEARLAAM